MSLSYFQAVVIGLLQGVTELFPISSLGHSVLLPKILGWDNLVQAQSQTESFYLAFLVGLHVATALALIFFFRDEWIRIMGGFFSSVRKRRIEKVVMAGPAGNLCVEAHFRDLLECGFEVAMVRDAIGGTSNEEGDGVQAALVHFRFLAHALWTTGEAVARFADLSR